MFENKEIPEPRRQQALVAEYVGRVDAPALDPGLVLRADSLRLASHLARLWPRHSRALHIPPAAFLLVHVPLRYPGL